MSAAEAQNITSLTITTLSMMRTDDAFQALFQFIESSTHTYGVEEACLPRKRKVPRRYDEGISNGDFSETVHDYYRR